MVVALPNAPAVESMLDAALALSRLGPVVPLHEAPNGVCSCGRPDCTSAAKHPRTPNGVSEATQDAAKIRAWWARWPSAGIGLATGALTVLDVDGPEGADTLRLLQAENGALPATLTVRTGNGAHLYYRSPEGVTIRNTAGPRGRGLGPGFDTRGHGGYVVAPPSVHANGARYAFEDANAPVAELPAWLVERLTAEPEPATPAQVVALRPVNTGATPERERRYAEAVLKGEAEAVRTAPQGSRNHALNAAAFAVGQFVATGALSEQDARGTLEAAAATAGLAPSEIAATMRSGLESGKRSPRDLPAPSPTALAVTPRGGTVAVLDKRPPISTAHRDLPELTGEALAALVKGNVPARVFVREGRLSRVTHDARSKAVIEPLSEDALRGELARTGRYVRPDKNGEPRSVAPPLDAVRDLRALGSWEGLPELEGLVEGPVMRPDGTVLTRPGYDEGSALYYSPGGPPLKLPTIPDKPSATDARHALELLATPLREFPFSTEADRANALALLLTPLVRPMISGGVPLALLEAPRAGTGKGLLADVVALLSTGKPAELTAAPRRDDELEKTLGALLIEGAPLVVLDECETLGGAFLCMSLTASAVRVRMLGRSATARVPQRAVWIATGNNVALRGDAVRRVYRVRLDAKLSTPWARTFERADLRGWVLDNRPELLAAALTVARAWVVAGRPGEPVQRLGGFEGFTRTLGGMLTYAGETGFLSNLATEQDAADEDAAAFEALLDALEAHYGTGEGFDVAGVAGLLDSSDGKALRDALPDELAALETGRLRARLGKALSSHRDTRYGTRGLRVERLGADSHSRRVRWAVQADTPRD